METPGFEFSDNNGTNHLSLYVNNEKNQEGTQVRLNFNRPSLAFGFESWVANDLEGSILEVYGAGGLLGSVNLDNADGAFAGYVLDGGSQAVSVLWRSRSYYAGHGGEGFGVDNLVGVEAVPEPASMATLVLGAISFLRRRRS